MMTTKRTTYTKVHMSDLKDDFIFGTTKAQSSPKKWGIHIEVWYEQSQEGSTTSDGWIDDEDFFFYATEQERDNVYTQMTGEINE